MIMRQKTAPFFSLFFVLLGNTLIATAAGDITKGETLSQTCLGCHGAPGFRNASPVYRVPMIGGQHANYIFNALKAYKNKNRSHPTMQAQAANLSDQDMQDISAYFQNLAGETRVVEKSQAAAGKKLATTCAGCHGENGNGTSDEFPKLAGQYDDFIERALLDYKSGKRKNAIMSGFTANLSKQDIKALSHWFRSQQGDLTAPAIKVKKSTKK